jgi:hypothetical protein
MREDLDKILQQQTINIISLMLATIFLYFKEGIYSSKELLEKIEDIKKKVENDKEIIKHFKVEYRSIKNLKFSHYFNSIFNKEVIIDYSDHNLTKNMSEICIPINEESLVCIDKENVEKLGYIFAFELDYILMHQKLNYDLLPYRIGKKLAKEILNIIEKGDYIDPFVMINFALISFVNGLLNGFFEKYRKLDKKEIEEISKNVYIFKSGEEYLNTLEKMLESIYYKDLKDIIRNSINLIKENEELFKEIENHGEIIGKELGVYLNKNPEEIHKINKYIEILLLHDY